jgi:hypothetical protein
MSGGVLNCRWDTTRSRRSERSELGRRLWESTVLPSAAATSLEVHANSQTVDVAGATLASFLQHSKDVRASGSDRSRKEETHDDDRVV